MERHWRMWSRSMATAFHHQGVMPPTFYAASLIIGRTGVIPPKRVDVFETVITLAFWSAFIPGSITSGLPPPCFAGQPNSGLTIGFVVDQEFSIGGLLVPSAPVSDGNRS